MNAISKPLVITLIFTIPPAMSENEAFSQDLNFYTAPGGTYSLSYLTTPPFLVTQGGAASWRLGESISLPLTGMLTTVASSTDTKSYSNETLTDTVDVEDIASNGRNAWAAGGITAAGRGNDGTSYTVTLSGTSSTPLTIAPASSGAIGLHVNSVGGDGGLGFDPDHGEIGADPGYSGAGGGGGGGIDITANGTVNITTSGDNAVGIQATSAGGTGGVAALSHNGAGNTGGYGGSAGSVTVDFSRSTADISTSGANAFGVLATSIAGDAGNNGADTEDGKMDSGSHGGNSGEVTISMGSATTINTSGTNAVGIVGRSVSGKGGDGGVSNAHGTGDGGDGGNGGDTGVITLNADGTITTHGTGAMGIFAQAGAGGGGAGGHSENLGGDAGKAGGGGHPAAITITNSGSITTNNDYAPGILGQSLSGAGGIGGTATGLFYSKGGAGGTSPDAGIVYITNTGAITTNSANSQGIVAQSIAGGGGMGGDAGGMFDTDGGSGGTGGAGGTISLTLGGTINTGGQNSHGAVAQSIGGGGGVGGQATGDGVSTSVTIGGNGGTAGDGGPVKIKTNGLALTAAGTASIGLLSQSIGGGGGAGGGAIATATGPLLAVGVAVGGTGGTGGSGGTSTVTVQNSSITTGTGTQDVTISTSEGKYDVKLPVVDSHGVVSQSIGGGGGNGGAGSAASYAIALPNNLGEGYYNVTFSGAFAIGGNGGDGGDGDSATATIDENSTVSTGGDGSIGVVVQSIGGGGGNGGDSSSMASTIGFGVPIPHFSSKITPATNAVNVSLAIGGSGGSGGNGKAATFQLGDSDNPNQSSITTNGAEAIGALIQSVGGGGGNGGIGNANVNSYATSQNADFTIALGGSGGSGGGGGTVTATISGNGTITTHGHGSEGVLAQSIGGGGGVGSGSAINASGLIGWVQGVAGIPLAKEVDDKGNKIAVGMNINPTVNVGATEGEGGDGGSVTISHGGKIDTWGIDAAGIVAQSIGGGGGSGGTAGADSSTGVLPGTSSSTTVTAGDPPPNGEVTGTIPVSVNPTITLGGGEEIPGNGGAVTIKPTGGSVTTRDDYSTGIIAQSIGGGGGRGAAVTVGTERGGTLDALAKLSVKTEVGLGASGDITKLRGSADVTVSLGGTAIRTGLPSSGATSATPNKGLHAYGILAQSIGGGGGVAIDGSPDPNVTAQLGAYLGGITPDISAVGDVTLTDSGHSTIGTQGDGAHGIVLQSIGLGGGVLGVGSSRFTPSGGSNRTVEVILGSSFDATREGWGLPAAGTVQATYASALTTSGNGAYGIVAQSIGGGGGLVSASQGVALSVDRMGVALLDGGQEGYSSHGAKVSVDLPSGSSVATTGVGSHGVVAQSIGGGGGIVASYQYGHVPKLVESLPAPAVGQGNGGEVTVTSNGVISVSGAGAYGILAQSIGGGGGMIATDGNVFLGSTRVLGDGGEGGAVTVDVQGSVSASGENGIGIVAQSDGNGSDSEAVTVNIGGDNPGMVSGGSGEQGVGILIAGGNSKNQINITENSWVWAASGNAIKTAGAWGTQKVTVSNHGQIYGNTWLQGGSINGNPQQDPGTKPPDEAAGTLTNSGTLVAMPGKRSYVDGHLIQTAAGQIAPHLDYSNLRAGTYVVTGNAVLDGTIRPNLASALPNIFLPALTVNGTVTGSLDAPDSPLFSYTLRENAGKYDIAITDTHFDDGRFGLTEHQSAVAGALESVFVTGDVELGAFFAGLDSSAGAELAHFRRALDTVAHRNVMAVFARAAADASRIADASMSCPKFDSTETGARAFLIEDSCIQATAGGQTVLLDGDSGRGEVDVDSTFWQVGGQTEIRPGLFLGGLIAYQTDSFSSQDGVSAKGSSGQGAVTLKYQSGPLLFTGAVFGSIGQYEIERAIVVPGFSTTASSSPHTYTAGIRGRVAYTLGSENFYLRPYLNVDLIHARSEGFSEDGAGGLGLRVDEVRYNTAVVTPAIEIGGRLQLSDDMVLRGYVSGGVNVRTNDTWEGDASFKGGALDQGLSLDVPMDQVSGRVSAGLQLFTSKHTDIRLQYDGEFGSQAQKHSASASFSYRF